MPWKYYAYGLGNLLAKSSTPSRSQIIKELTFIKLLQKKLVTWLGPILHDYNDLKAIEAT
jgi:hypothetical protein